MSYLTDEGRCAAGRAPYGARGLKYPPASAHKDEKERRAPYGARGLKSHVWRYPYIAVCVAPRMGRVD